MNCPSLRRVRKGIAACVLLLGAMAPLLRAADKPETFYYLAIPAFQKEGILMSVACIKLDRQGLPVDAKAKTGKTGAVPFFSIWYSSPWEQKAPDSTVKSALDWKHDLESKAERAMAKNEVFSELPVPIVRFVQEIEKLRCASPQEIVFQPLFKDPDFVGWENVKHLNVLATASPLSAEQRSKAFLFSLREPKETDPAKTLSLLFSTCGVKARSVRYWPKYNLLLIEAGADFEDEIETLFSPMY